MKLGAAAITPRRAEGCQNGTQPAAESTQILPLSGTPQVSAAAARCGAAATPAQTASRMRSSLFTTTLLQSSSVGGKLPPTLQIRYSPSSGVSTSGTSSASVDACGFGSPSVASGAPP